MKIGERDSSEAVFVIAEIGNNHEGNIDLAAELIGRAADSGADAVKFQTYNTETLISPADAIRFNRMKKFEFSKGAFTKLSNQARDLGLAFISTPFDLPSVTFLNGIVDAIKIASGDNTFPQLIASGARTGKPLIMSTGLASIEEVHDAVNEIKASRLSIGSDLDLSLLHCISSYPTLPEDANLAAIPALRNSFPGCFIGYSDHTIGIEVAVAAVAAGACLIEKHFTIDNNYSEFRDHQLSATPDTLRQMIERIRDISAWMGTGKIELAGCESEGASSFRRSAYAARDISSGDKITKNDILWLRPGGGIPPKHGDRAIGRKVERTISRGQIIDPDQLD